MRKKASIYHLEMYDDQGEYIPTDSKTGMPLKECPLNLIYSIPLKNCFYVVAYGLDDAYKIMTSLKKSLKLKKRIGEAFTGNYPGCRGGKTYLSSGIYYGPLIRIYDETKHHKLKMAFEDFDPDKIISKIISEYELTPERKKALIRYINKLK